MESATLRGEIMMVEAQKLQLNEVRQRSLQGIKRFSAHLRPTLYGFTFHSKPVSIVPLSELRTKDKVLSWIYRNGGAGTWYLMAPCPNKHTKTGMGMKAILKVTLQEDPNNEWKYIVTEYREMRLYRYRKMWGWPGD